MAREVLSGAGEKTLRIGVGQFDALSGDTAFNAGQHAQLIGVAGLQSADLVVFPELSMCGYASDVLDRSPTECILDVEGSDLAMVRHACKEAGVAAVIGACMEGESGMTLSSIMIDRLGNICGRYDKQHLDDRERRWFVPGKKGCIIAINGWRFGHGICYDASFPEHARAVASRGADGYLISAAFPLGESARRRSIYLPARALENTLYVAFSNYTGSHAGLSYCGLSSIHGPDGRLIVKAGDTDSEIVVAELRQEHLREVRQTLTMLGDHAKEQSSVREIELL